MIIPYDGIRAVIDHPSIESLFTGYLQNKHDWYPTFSVDRLKYASGVDTLLKIFGMIYILRG